MKFQSRDTLKAINLEFGLISVKKVIKNKTCTNKENK